MSAATATLLCADIGNGDTALALLPIASGVSEGATDDVVASWRVSTDERRTSDEWASLVGALLTDGPQSEIQGIAVCATVPGVLASWREMLPRRFPGLPVVIVEPGIRSGIAIRMDNPREVGADRIANAVAAATLHGGPAIVVDFGTATTFDVIDGAGAYIGGAIAPGIAISLQALGRRGAQLREVELLPPRSVNAKNTVEALRSGTLHGAACLVDGMVERIIGELGVDRDGVSVISTGHLAGLVVDRCACFTHHDPWLTMRGLRQVFGSYRPEAPK